MMTAALWANSGFEGKEGANARQEAIEELERNFDNSVEAILSGRKSGEEDIDKDNPFFAASERAMEKIKVPENTAGTVKEALPEYEVDQD